jgi:hypothetical protein
MIWDPIECTPSLYLDFVLFWPDDGFLQQKHVAKILKYCQVADIYVVFLDNNKILLYVLILFLDKPNFPSGIPVTVCITDCHTNLILIHILQSSCFFFFSLFTLVTALKVSYHSLQFIFIHMMC